MKITIYQITLSAFMCAIGILLGFYGTFQFGGGGIYLIGIAIFLMPLVLKFPMLIISTVIVVVMSDFYSGYIAYTWISCIAYLSAVIIIWIFNKILKFKLIYMLSTLIASIIVVAIFFFLSWAIPGYNQARVIKDTIGTTIEVSIAFVASSILYLPFKMIPKGR